MFIEITHRGESLYLRRLSPTENIDPEFHAQRFVDAYYGEPIAKPNGHIPRGCADFYAEVRDTKAPTAVCWASFDFYLEDR